MKSTFLALSLTSIFAAVSAVAASTAPFFKELSADSNLALALNEVLPYDMASSSPVKDVTKGFIPNGKGTSGFVVTCSTVVDTPSHARTSPVFNFSGCTAEKTAKKPENVPTITLEQIFTEAN